MADQRLCGAIDLGHSGVVARCIERTVQIEPREKTPGRSVERVKMTARDDPIVRLRGETHHNVVEACAGVETRVHGAVSMQQRDVDPRFPINVSEVAIDRPASIEEQWQSFFIILKLITR